MKNKAFPNVPKVIGYLEQGPNHRNPVGSGITESEELGGWEDGRMRIPTYFWFDCDSNEGQAKWLPPVAYKESK